LVNWEKKDVIGWTTKNLDFISKTKKVSGDNGSGRVKQRNVWHVRIKMNLGVMEYCAKEENTLSRTEEFRCIDAKTIRHEPKIMGENSQI